MTKRRSTPKPPAPPTALKALKSLKGIRTGVRAGAFASFGGSFTASRR
ncbi:MAG: hypothetical protein U0325_00655 [Polyangiales bacterium]